VTAAELRRRRSAAQLLADGRERGAADAVRHLLAVQAQDLRSMRLALLARRVDGMDAALAGGELVCAWLLRGTLHLVAAEDFGWLHALTEPLQAAGSARRLAQLGIAGDAERGVAAIERALADGPLDRAALAERIAAAGVRADGQRTPHLLGLAAQRGLIVFGPGAYVLARDWLPPARPVDRDAALAELGTRYLRGHAPAEPDDLAAWSGLPLGDARAALAAARAPRTRVPGRLPPRLLPAFDPYLLGWRDRSFAVAPEHAKAVHPGGGMLRATAVANGRAVGTWTFSGGRVELHPFAPLPGSVAAALEREARRLERARTGSDPFLAR
jgi:hypothetical protein